MTRERGTLSDNLTRRVLDLIRSEGLGMGDRLPPVRSLAERFSVAAPTVREALRRLQASGVVELRHGSGVYVRNDQERIVLSNPGHRKLDAGTMLHLLEARLLIEPHLAGLAAENVDGVQVAELGRHLDRAESCLDGEDDNALHRANMEFHRAVAACSGNSILSQVIDSLVELYSSEQRAILKIYDDRSRDHQEHREIFAAIRVGDPELARREMHRHLRGVKQIVQDELSGEGNAADGGR
jgi:GntR family transcriptional regulator, transcriptional repressor for pyruvate dehydrogenase complex